MSDLDPRTKIFLGATAITAVLFTRSPEFHSVESLALLIGLFHRRMIGFWGLSMRLMGPMIVLVFVVGLISFDLETASLLSIRLFNLLTVSFLFFRTMPPEQMGDGLRKLGLPYELSFILTTSMRYVPLIGRRIRLIMEAQMSRGIDLRPRFRNMRNFMALLMPLLIQSFLLSEELAMAMEARGFGLKGRTYRRDYRFSARDAAWMVLSLILLVSFLLWERG